MPPTQYQESVLTLIKLAALNCPVIVGLVDTTPFDASVTPDPWMIDTVPPDPILITLTTDPVVIATVLNGGIVIVVVPVFEYVISLLSASVTTNVSDVAVTALTVKLAMLFI